MADRTRGLLGRSGYDGAMLLPAHPRRSTPLGMRFALDVAFLDRDLVVLATVRLAPGGWPCPARGPAACWRPRPGAFERWRLAVGDRARDPGDPLTRGGRLVLVATPIGNLGDLSPRAVAVLADADVICCEDTRRTRALLSAAGVAGGGRLVSLHAHNEAARIAQVLALGGRGPDGGGGDRRRDPGRLGPRRPAGGRRRGRRG